MSSTELSQKRLNIVMLSGFALVGVVNTFLGPLLPLLSVQWSLNDAQAGRLFAAQYAGGIVGALASSPILTRFGYLRTLLAGYIVMSAASACFGYSSAFTAIPSIFCEGVSLGLLVPATNVLAAEMYPSRQAEALNLANFAWGVGAIAGPPVLVYFARSTVLLPMLGLAAMLAAVTLWLLRCASGVPAVADAGADDSQASSVLQAWTAPFALCTGLLIFLYVGTEVSTYGWVASYARRLVSSSQKNWMLAQTAFWIGLIGSRALAPSILRRISTSGLIISGMMAANLGLLTILLSSELSGAITGAALAGLGMGPIFPTVFARFTQGFGALAARMAGILFVISNLGAGSFPWAVGLISAHFGGLRSGLVVPLAAAALMAAVQTAMILFPSSQNTTGRGFQTRRDHVFEP